MANRRKKILGDLELSNEPEKKREVATKKPKVAKRLSRDEKWKILELYSEGLTIQQVAEQTGRTFPTVSKVVEESKMLLFKAFDTDISNVPENIDVTEDYKNTQVYKNVLNRLTKNGIDIPTAEKRIAKIINSIDPNEIKVVSEEDLYNAALRIINGSELFINKSASNREGIAIMTTAASERGDDSTQKAHNHKKNNIVDNHRVFKI